MGKNVSVIESSTSPEDDIYIRSLSFAFLYIGYFKHIFSDRAISLFLIFSFRFNFCWNDLSAYSLRSRRLEVVGT